jgi:hypothetical protein
MSYPLMGHRLIACMARPVERAACGLMGLRDRRQPPRRFFIRDPHGVVISVLAHE